MSKKITKHIIIIHDNDQDGYCSMAITAQALKQPHIEITNLPIKHNDDRNISMDDKYTDIYILDYSMPVTWVEHNRTLGKNVTVIDHHKSTIDMWSHAVELKDNTRYEDNSDATKGSLTLIFDEQNNNGTTKSASLLTWEYFHPNKEVPWAVTMINNWDIWNHEDPQVVMFHYGMQCVNLSDKYLWKELFSGNVESCARIMQIGQLVGSHWVVTMNEMAETHSFEIDMKDMRLVCCNNQFRSSYDMESVFDETKHDAVCWFWFDPTNKNRPWKFSARTNKDGINLLNIAEAFNGGGHPHSCGWSMTGMEFSEFLNYAIEPKEQSNND